MIKKILTLAAGIADFYENKFETLKEGSIYK